MASTWSISVGPHGATVRARERRRGGNVYLEAYDPSIGGTRRQSLGFKVRDTDGKLVEESVVKAKAKAAELSNRLIAGEAPGRDVTVSDLFKLFRREEVRHNAERYRKVMRRQLAAWEQFLGPRFVVSRFGPREWNAYTRQRASGEIDARGKRVSDPDKRTEVSPRTVAKDLKLFRQACLFGTRYRTRRGDFLLGADPTRGLDLPKTTNPRRPVCDDQRYEALLKVADRVEMGQHDTERSYLRELLVLAAHTGRRIGAIVALRWSDWTPDAGSYGVLRWRAEEDKIGREWTAPVTPEVREALQALLRERAEVGEKWIFPAPESDGHIRVDVTRKWLLKAETLAKLDHPDGFGWHALRRMWASKRKHMSLKDVAHAGGWKDTQTLQRCYQTPDPESLEEVVMGGRELRLSADEG